MSFRNAEQHFARSLASSFGFGGAFLLVENENKRKNNDVDLYIDSYVCNSVNRRAACADTDAT